MFVGAFVAAIAAPLCPHQDIEVDWVRTASAAACPTAQDVRERVQARLQCRAFADAPGAWFETLVDRVDDTWQARLTRLEADGSVLSSTNITDKDPSCESVAEAVALPIAVVAERLPARTRTATTSRVLLAPDAPAPPRIIEGNPLPRGSVQASAILNLGTLPSPSFGMRVDGHLMLTPRWSLTVGVMGLPPRAFEGYFYSMFAGGGGGCALTRPSVSLSGCVRAYGGTLSNFGGAQVLGGDTGSNLWLALGARPLA